MGRRAVLLGMAAVLAAPPASGTQPPERAARVSIYATTPTWGEAIVGVLRDRGRIEGRTIAFTWQKAEGSEAHIAEHLAMAPPDVLVLGGALRVRAAMRATTTIPMIGLDLETDPVASGFVKTLARPGGNVSGIWVALPEIAGKQIRFLREVVPGLTRLGVIWDDRIGQPQFIEVQAACRTMHVGLHAASVHVLAEIDDAMKRVVAERPQAIVVLTAPVISNGLPRIAELMLASRLPAISPFSTFPGFGGLLSANQKTARDIGLALSPSLILRADDVLR